MPRQSQSKTRYVVLVGAAVSTAIAITCGGLGGGVSAFLGIAVDWEDALARFGVKVEPETAAVVFNWVFIGIVISVNWVFAFAFMFYFGWLPWQHPANTMQGYHASLSKIIETIPTMSIIEPGQSLIIDVSLIEPLKADVDSLPRGIVGQPYSAQLRAKGGKPPYSWTAVGLPVGITVNKDGLVSGIPTEPANRPKQVGDPPQTGRYPRGHRRSDSR